MAKTIVVKPLGLVLRQAGLVSSKQVKKALEESLTLPQCKVGEVLAIRGWIKPETADFFAEVWPKIITQTTNKNTNKRLQPLGQYLKAASLISQQQINQLLKIQETNSIKFGKLAVENNIISQTTLDFFLEHLNLIKTEDQINVYPEDIALELDTIENYLLNNQKCEPTKLLTRYQTIRKKGKIVADRDTVEQELLASGIVVRNNNLIQIAKPIYENSFDDDWLEEELANLQPYNQIRLEMFDLKDKAVIPHKIINAVNYWTNHEPFLTQKTYQLVQEKSAYISSGKEATTVEELVYQHIINDWKSGVAAKHFQRICDRIGRYSSDRLIDILTTYKKIYQLKEIDADSSWSETELLRIGLIESNNKRVKINNLIYQAVFDLRWIHDNLANSKTQLSFSSANKLVVESEKTALFNRSFPFKTKYFLSVVAIILVITNSYFIVKMLDYLAENKQPIRHNIIQ